MKIEQLMSSPAKTCKQSDTLDCVARIMWESDCGIVPVIDDAGRAVGMITDRDICMAAYTQGKPLAEISVGTAASRTVFTVHPGDSPRTAEKTMRDHKVRRLAVTDDGGRLLGVVSLNDLARHSGRRASDLEPGDVAKTLAAICEPIAPTTSARA